ncbi:hypothetical protein KDA_64260 [Dictyobacter alpinus]|uniref:Uncharacterized protein n=2 Tax=Dictyobacter alpinus TaxID=2014873 RepID=A0A402BI78_9CHLR|nr:hypothetical protein KDA_64260 [Dictyobacter alpinus]
MPYTPMMNYGAMGYAPLTPRLTRKSGWGLDKKQLIAMVVGLIIVGAIQFANYKFTPGMNSQSAFFQPLGNSFYFPSLYSISLGLLLGIIFFFGVKFGPWVGLILALIPPVAACILFDPRGAGALLTFWYEYAADAFAGFFVGITFVITKDRYKASMVILIAFGMSMVAIIIDSIAITVVDALYNLRYALPYFLSSLSAVFLASLCSLVPLIVLLFISEKIIGKRTRSTNNNG